MKNTKQLTVAIAALLILTTSPAANSTSKNTAGKKITISVTALDGTILKISGTSGLNSSGNFLRIGDIAGSRRVSWWARKILARG